MRTAGRAGPAVVLAVVGVVGFIALPERFALSWRHRLVAEAAAYGNDAASLRQRARAARQVASHQSEVDASVGRLLAAVPRSADIDSVIADLDTLSRAAGIALLYSNHKVDTEGPPTTPPAAPRPRAATRDDPPVPPPPRYVTIMVSFRVRGDADGIERFLAALATAPRLVVVDSVKLTAEAGGGLTASVEARAFEQVPAGGAITDTGARA